MHSPVWRRFLVLAAAGGLLCALPAGASPSALPGPGTAAAADGTVADWSSRLWAAAMRGDSLAVDRLLGECPSDTDGRFAKAVSQLRQNTDNRELKRAERIRKVSDKLDRLIADRTAGDLGLSMALQTAVELYMLATDANKEAVLGQQRIRDLVKSADAAARAAEARGDWLTANELFSRLNLLLEEKGLYEADVRRENQRLAMIRLYDPERFWELRNNRRNAEIEWRKTQKADEDEDPGIDPDEAQKVKAAQLKPLPPYNPTGDSYQDKLGGIDESIVIAALNRASARHVEKTPLEKMLRGGLKAVATLATTDDLKKAFPGIADDAARTRILNFVRDEEARLPEKATTPDLYSVVTRLVSENERTLKLPKEALLHEFANGCMAALDEFSAIIWPDEIKRFNKNTQGKFVGVGIQIELDPLWNIRVVTPLDGTPAQRAGVRPGDIIRKVDGRSTEGFTIDQAVDVITGQQGTQVTLTLERTLLNDKGEPTAETSEVEYTLTRSIINEATVKGWRRTGPGDSEYDWFIDRDAGIGYIRLTKFAESTDKELDRAIDQLKEKGVNGVILDLRFNPGGLLEQAVAVTSRFIDRERAGAFGGNVVTTHDKDNKLQERQQAAVGRARLAGIPVVVLINEGSASASEIVSGALQDYASASDARVLVMGNRSYGKGSVQNVWGLGSGNAAIKVTTQYYHLPSGRIIHRLPAASQWGVEPNYKVDMLPSQVVQSLVTRQNADVIRINQEGQPDATKADPDELITKGSDLQLNQALVLLEAQALASAANKPIVQKPAASTEAKN
jgi:carboxyl-terminal processing protease